MKANGIDIKTEEALLATIIEKQNEQDKRISDICKCINDMHNELERVISILPRQMSDVSKADNDLEFRQLKENNMELLLLLRKIKEQNDQLKKEKRNLVPQLWMKSMFRWVFARRHVCAWIVFGFFLLFSVTSFYAVIDKSKTISELRVTEWKYRYMRVFGLQPEAICYLDELWEVNDPELLKQFRRAVRKAEKDVAATADSLVHSKSPVREKVK